MSTLVFKAPLQRRVDRGADRNGVDVREAPQGLSRPRRWRYPYAAIRPGRARAAHVVIKNDHRWRRAPDDSTDGGEAPSIAAAIAIGKSATDWRLCSLLENAIAAGFPAPGTLIEPHAELGRLVIPIVSSEPIAEAMLARLSREIAENIRTARYDRS